MNEYHKPSRAKEWALVGAAFAVLCLFLAYRLVSHYLTVREMQEGGRMIQESSRAFQEQYRQLEKAQREADKLNPPAPSLAPPP